MNPKDFDKSIHAGIASAIDFEVSDWRFLASPTSLPPSSEFNRVSLKSGVKYEDVYKEAIRLNYFNFMLTDSSFFQFSRWDEKGEVRVRLAYFPSPYSGIDEYSSFFESSLESDPELMDQIFDEVELFIDRPPIRYDLDLLNHKPCKHPAAHMHVGAFTNSRWPVRLIMYPETFIFFILKHYYPESWSNLELLNDKSGFDNIFDKKYADALNKCPNLQSHHFTPIEMKHLSIG